MEAIVPYLNPTPVGAGKRMINRDLIVRIITLVLSILIGALIAGAIAYNFFSFKWPFYLSIALSGATFGLCFEGIRKLVEVYQLHKHPATPFLIPSTTVNDLSRSEEKHVIDEIIKEFKNEAWFSDWENLVNDPAYRQNLHKKNNHYMISLINSVQKKPNEFFYQFCREGLCTGLASSLLEQLQKDPVISSQNLFASMTFKDIYKKQILHIMHIFFTFQEKKPVNIKNFEDELWGKARTHHSFKKDQHSLAANFDTITIDNPHFLIVEMDFHTEGHTFFIQLNNPYRFYDAFDEYTGLYEFPTKELLIEYVKKHFVALYEPQLEYMHIQKIN